MRPVVVPDPYLTQLAGVGALEWRRTVSRLLVDIEMSGGDVGSFEGHLACRTVRGVRFVDVTASPSQARSTRGVEAAGRALILCYQFSGNGVIRQDGREAQLRPGDLAVYTTARPSEVVFGTEFRAMSLRVPLEMFALPMGRIDPLMATVLPSGLGLGPVMGGYLEQVAPILDNGSPADRLQAARAGVELFTTMVRASLSGVEPAIGDRGNSLRILEHIEANLGDPDLSPTTIAAAVHISVRHLHNQFTSGDTVAAFIRRRRLSMCERDLTDPARVAESVAMIARRWGFESASHFGQLFRERTGVSPVEYRRQAQRNLAA